jgi:hypothetical protein
MQERLRAQAKGEYIHSQPTGKAEIPVWAKGVRCEKNTLNHNLDFSSAVLRFSGAFDGG